MGVYRRGDSWYIRYAVNGCVIRESIGQVTRTAAKNILAKRKAQVAENRWLDVRREKQISFKQMATAYLERYSKPNRRPYRYKYECYYMKRLIAEFGESDLSDITPDMIEAYKLKLKASGLKNASMNRYLELLRAMYNRAIEWGMAESNPMRSVKLLKPEPRQFKLLMPDELQRLVDACPVHLKPVVILAMHTGMRRGEVLNLKWQQIDFKTRIVHLTRTKNSEKREVPMDDTVTKLLITLPRRIDTDYVFANREGKPYWELKRSWKTALKHARIEGVRFHDLRHLYASYLVMSGTDLRTVQELLGHKDYRMTLRYSHLADDHKRTAQAKLDRILSESDTESDTGAMVGKLSG